jgi:hypothetical protein
MAGRTVDIAVCVRLDFKHLERLVAHPWFGADRA